MSARHRRQLDKAKARRLRGVQSGHRFLPDVDPIANAWDAAGLREFDPGTVRDALNRGGESLANQAMALSANDVMGLCREFRLEPETVLDICGPDIFAATVQALSGDKSCLVRQIDSIRRFLHRPDMTAQLDEWLTVRIAS